MDGELRILFRKNLPMVHWCSIETAGTEPGVPDMNGCYGGREFWVEMKKCQANSVGVNAAQVGWHERRARAGGSSFFAVRYKKDTLVLVLGKNAALLKNGGLSSVPALGSWDGGPPGWDWLEVLYLATGLVPQK